MICFLIIFNVSLLYTNKNTITMKKVNPYSANEFFHVIKTKNKLEVISSTFHECTKVENSIASFSKREFAINHLNNNVLT